MEMRYLPMPAEDWRTVPGFPNYEVSDEGRVRGPNGILTPRVHPRGYLRVNLLRSGGRSTFPIHRLVLEAFVGPKPEGMECRHLNDCKADNRLANLRWGTPKENGQDAVRNGRHEGQNLGETNGAARLTAEAVREIRTAPRHHGYIVDLARKFGVAKSTVDRARTGRNWGHVE